MSFGDVAGRPHAERSEGAGAVVHVARDGGAGGALDEPPVEGIAPEDPAAPHAPATEATNKASADSPARVRFRGMATA